MAQNIASTYGVFDGLENDEIIIGQKTLYLYNTMMTYRNIGTPLDLNLLSVTDVLRLNIITSRINEIESRRSKAKRR